MSYDTTCATCWGSIREGEPTAEYTEKRHTMRRHTRWQDCSAAIRRDSVNMAWDGPIARNKHLIHDAHEMRVRRH